MNKGLKITISILCCIAFVAANVLCCCLIKKAVQAMGKPACSHCASQGASSANSECCFTKASPMEIFNLQAFHINWPLMAMFVVVFFYMKPQRRLVLRNTYMNGPPGPYALIPLYIKARSIRI